jgi:hypothetical protein
VTNAERLLASVDVRNNCLMMTVRNRNACASLPRGDYRSERCCVEAADGEHEEACMRSAMIV